MLLSTKIFRKISKLEIDYSQGTAKFTRYITNQMRRVLVFDCLGFIKNISVIYVIKKVNIMINMVKLLRQTAIEYVFKKFGKRG